MISLKSLVNQTVGCENCQFSAGSGPNQYIRYALNENKNGIRPIIHTIGPEETFCTANDMVVRKIGCCELLVRKTIST